MMLNPILRREARTSLRSWKIFLVICLYVGFIAGVSYLFLKVSMWSSVYSGFDPKSVIALYALLSGFQFGAILIITPALTSGSISGERERQTLDLLIVTKMKPFSIVFGKLVSGIGIILLLIIATMPVYAVMFYFGGVKITDILVMTGFVLATSCFVGSMSIMFSSVYKKTIVSMIVVYIITGFLCFGTWILLLVYHGVYIQGYLELYDYFSIKAFYGTMFLNPAAGFFSLVDSQLGTGIFSQLIYNYGSGTAAIVPIWIVNIIAELVFSVIFLKIAAARINPLNKRK
ncbi:ABC transporter permease [Anaerotignum faecicola]|nr:ABC transporter permease [Anaerotignum faecicola]